MDVLTPIYNNIKSIAFQPDGDDYVVSESFINPYKESVHKVIETTHLYGLEVILDNFIKQLQSIRISEEELNNYKAANIISENIQNYFQIKQLFELDLACIEFSSAHTPLPEPKPHVGYFDTYVLNKRNPFADVEIKPQQFLYKENGSYKTLSFSTGLTMTKHSTDKGSILALKPSFSIEKTTSRNSNAQNIILDDTVSTLLPDETDGMQLIYI